MKGDRLSSLDAFRGFTVAAMILVNFPGDENHVFFTLRHSKWNALSFTDLLAPFFLYIVGVSISFAYKEVGKNGPISGKIRAKIFYRSLKIFAIGMFLNLLPDFNFSDLRWTGTLHRIAVVFFICALLYIHTNWKQQAWICLALLVGYWVIILGIPTPGAGKVVMEPGNNIAAWVDRKWLPGKMWQGTWDPEGILTIIPTCATTLTGILAGQLLQRDLSPNVKVNYLMTAGVLAAAAGYFLGLTFPVNENLWTSSFVLVTSGFASLVLGTMYFRMDILKKKKGTAFGMVYGSNAITAYVTGDVLAILFFDLKFGGMHLNEYGVRFFESLGCSPELASLAYALVFVFINLIPVYLLYRKKVFIKL